MKSTIVVCALVMLACLCLQANAVCEIDGVQLKEGVNYHKCTKITCIGGESMTAVGCAEWRCQEGKQIGYQDTDLSKPYPSCCPGPICAP